MTGKYVGRWLIPAYFDGFIVHGTSGFFNLFKKRKEKITRTTLIILFSFQFYQSYLALRKEQIFIPKNIYWADPRRRTK